MNNEDIRKEIWSYLRTKPIPLKYKCRIFYFHKDKEIINNDYKFGDIYINVDESKIFIFNNLNKFQQISNSNKDELLIPISITKDIINSVEFFEELFDSNYDITIQLRNDDIFIQNNFRDLPDYWKYSFVNKMRDNIYYLIIKFNNFLEKDFLINRDTREDIFKYFNKSSKKQTKFYIHISKDENITKMSLSNYEDEYDCNFFEFYVNKLSYDKYILLPWVSNILKNHNIPVYWDISLIKFFNDPMYVCIEFKGPLSDRSELLTKIKYDYNILDQLFK